MDWITLGPLVAKLLSDLIIAERARRGLTTEQIFDRAGLKLDANEAKLLEDLERLQPPNP